MKRVFGYFEAIFDILYLGIALTLGVVLLIRGTSQPAQLAGVMALILAMGDAFHLVPRIGVVLTGNEEGLRPALGRGKKITSITMTIFYLFLWHIGLLICTQAVSHLWTILVYLLAAVRIILCLHPQNQWTDRYPPLSWAIWRNIPFFLMGAAVALLYGVGGNEISGIRLVWLAIAVSFGCYLPVVLWSNSNPKVGMLMLPKTCAYLWIIFMCLSL